MSAFLQIFAVTWLNLKSIPSRWGSSGVIVIGIGGVVAVLVSVLAMSEGFKHTLSSTGKADRVIVLREGANAELSSTVTREAAQTLAGLAGVARGPNGKALISAEASVILNVPKNGVRANVALRGVGPQGLAIRPELQIVAGRIFTPGLREMIVGIQATQQFDGLAIGQTLHFREADWTIVGHFSTNGDVHESELWADGDTVLAAYRRNVFQSAIVQLTEVAAFERFQAAIKNDPRLRLDAYREPEYYASQSKALATFINIMGNTISAVMAVGALFGALNSLYAAVATRTREIATLRALGFSGAAVVVSVVTEALFLAGLGGSLGGGIAYLAFNGFSVATLNVASFSQVAFQLSVPPSLLAKGLLWALLIGFFGALAPALSAARLSVADALRAG